MFHNRSNQTAFQRVRFFFCTPQEQQWISFARLWTSRMLHRAPPPHELPPQHRLEARRKQDPLQQQFHWVRDACPILAMHAAHK